MLRSSFSDFCQRYGKDDRYKAIEKVRERESLFNEYIVDVRRQEKEEKIQKKEQVCACSLKCMRAENAFVCLVNLGFGPQQTYFLFKYLVIRIFND